MLFHAKQEQDMSLTDEWVKCNTEANNKSQLTGLYNPIYL
jgi:hypothetical protein